jgi:hypothetical protein
VHRQRIARFDQVTSHGVSHVAKANKKNVWKCHGLFEIERGAFREGKPQSKKKGVCVKCVIGKKAKYKFKTNSKRNQKKGAYSPWV